MQRREGLYFQALFYLLIFCFLILPSHFYPFVSNAFPWHLFFLKQKKKKKNTKKKKAIEKNKKCKKGKELTFLLSLLHLG
jgi:hypothetical protein